MEQTGITMKEFRAAMSSFAAGVTVITTLDSVGVPQAVTATAFSSVSMSPPLCLVCIAKETRAHQPLLARRSFVVNILRAGQESLSDQFAGPLVDRFTAVPWVSGRVTGCPIIHGALTWMECEVVEVHSAGDHDIFLARPTAVKVQDGMPLVYWRGSYSSLPLRPKRNGFDPALPGNVTTERSRSG